MIPEDIVFGQKVSQEKLRLARELRHNMTAEECMLWKQLRAHRLQGLHFRRQQVIDGYIVDFFCSEIALVVEVDGGVHRMQVEYDAKRDCALAERGLRVLHIANDEVRANLPAVLARIVATVGSGAPPSDEAQLADAAQFPPAGDG